MPSHSIARWAHTEVTTMAFTIEIMANDDGTYTVSSEPEAQEGTEGSEMGQGMPPGAPMQPGMAGPEEAEPAGQTFKSVKECLTVVLAGLKNGGQLPDMAKQNAAFDEGFNGGPQAGGDLGKMRGGM